MISAFKNNTDAQLSYTQERRSPPTCVDNAQERHDTAQKNSDLSKNTAIAGSFAILGGGVMTATGVGAPVGGFLFNMGLVTTFGGGAGMVTTNTARDKALQDKENCRTS
jgi:predicted phage tail protein